MRSSGAWKVFLCGVLAGAFSPASSWVHRCCDAAYVVFHASSSPLSSRSCQSSSSSGHHRRRHYLSSSHPTPHACSSSNADADHVSTSHNDKIQLGSLMVPAVGTGTIAWSSDKPFGSLQTNNELEDLFQTTLDANAAFFDTAERYGSHLKTALGMGWGETETLLGNMMMMRNTKPQHAISFMQQENHNNNNNNAAEPFQFPPSTTTSPSSSFLSSSSSSSSKKKKNAAVVVVATKFTPSPWRTTVESVVQACEESRRRLGVEQIDLYQLHMPDIVQPFKYFFGEESKRSTTSTSISNSASTNNKDEIYWQGLVECYRRGLVKNVGVCNYGPTLLGKCQDALAKKGVPLASNQIAYSLIGRHNGAQETVDACHERGIAVLAYYPFAMGLLTGKYHPTIIQQQHGQLNDKMISTSSLTSSQKTRLEELDLLRYARGDDTTIPRGSMDKLIHELYGIGQGRQKTVAQVALNYIICKGATPIPGARTAAQVADNLGAMGWRLENEEVARLEHIADSLGFGFEGAGFKRTSEKFVGYGVEKWVLN